MANEKFTVLVAGFVWTLDEFAPKQIQMLSPLKKSNYTSNCTRGSEFEKGCKFFDQMAKTENSL